MDRSAVETFAIWAREKLIQDVTFKAELVGVSETGISEPLAQSTKDLQLFDIGTKSFVELRGKSIVQRRALVEAIRIREKVSDYQKAFAGLIEEVAYTWFNRLIAIRFMEVNRYLPSGIKVLSSEQPDKIEPDLVTNPFEAGLPFTEQEKTMVWQLKEENRTDELFQLLFIKQCNVLHEILPDLFEQTEDYSELLLPFSFTDRDGVVSRLNSDIDEIYFDVSKEGQIEIIGWLYQYYISEKRRAVVDAIGKKKISKENIPAATQLFTTDWVVRYMVDNSLGRYWIERNPQSNLVEYLTFFVPPKSGDMAFIDQRVMPQDLTFMDPCMGSGHILVYAFDVLMQIYRESGYTDREASLNILEHNLYGMDIDKRAYQLAYFALMMKARSYNRHLFDKPIKTNLVALRESNAIANDSLSDLPMTLEQREIAKKLVEVFYNAEEVGSLIQVEDLNYGDLIDALDQLQFCQGQIDLLTRCRHQTTLPLLIDLASQADLLAGRYAVVCTNPPYMNKFDTYFKKYAKTYYKDYSRDLFSMFIYRNFGLCREDGYTAFMTPNVWLYIKSYAKLRKYIISQKGIVTLVEMAKGAFYKEATVDVCAFVLSNKPVRRPGLYFILDEFKGDMTVQKEKVLAGLDADDCSYLYEAETANFEKLPGSPIVAWVSDEVLNDYERGTPLDQIADPRQGIATTDNNRFLRMWYEVAFDKIGFNLNSDQAAASGLKWFPLNKGGAFRKWYGNHEYVVNYQHDGAEIKENVLRKYKYLKTPDFVVKNQQFYFRECLSWSKISSGETAFRFYPPGFIFEVSGCAIFIDDPDEIMYLFGFLNSAVTARILAMISPTLNYEVGHIRSLPILHSEEYRDTVISLVKENIVLAKADWDSFETSWDFSCHPLVCDTKTIAEAFERWARLCDTRFKKMQENEETLNRIFIDLYNLEGEVLPHVSEKNVSVRRADPARDVRSLISYAVGCMFGRYFLDCPGLCFTGGSWKQEQYESFLPNTNHFLLITDEAYFQDDIVARFETFIETVYGASHLEENLTWIAEALGKKGKSSRAVIRNYFLKDFYNDHCQTYQKRPIYWLFNSGKQDGFKALVYMHGWDSDLIGKVRVEGLHSVQRIYENEIQRLNDIIEDNINNREKSEAEKRKLKLIKQLQETKQYDEKIAHLAYGRKAIHLDDGVLYNHRYVQTTEQGETIKVLASI